MAFLNRFKHLEIGAGAPAAAPGEPSQELKRLCAHCGQSNEKQRDVCWACFQKLNAETKTGSAQDITLVIDGTTYLSSDPAVPADIRELMDRIAKNGYSPELLAEWQSWRATRSAAPPEIETRGADPARDIKVFKGQRVSVIRLDGKVYTSDDANLPPEIKKLFLQLDVHGVTPALMDELRAVGGGKVELHPLTTANPSDADLEFWNDVHAARPQEIQARHDYNLYSWAAAAAAILAIVFYALF